MGTTPQREPYPPIGDYGFIADCHSSALVSRSGSIDWCCMPRIDSRTCFARLLDWKMGGYCQLAPIRAYTSSRRYLPDTMVLETTFRAESGRARLLDCFTMRQGGKRAPHRQLLRIVEGLEGTLDFALDLAPVFDYGAIRAWIREAGDGQYTAIGGSDGLLVSGDFPLAMKHRHHLVGHCRVEPGQRVHLSLIYMQPEDLDQASINVPETHELDRRLDETIEWWKAWSGRTRLASPYEQWVRRSAIVLKGLTHAPTGAIAAASTTSLPEAPGGQRNWDYRYSWVRDSAFTVRSLVQLGQAREADAFRRFVERSAAGSADEIQILFGVGGERRLHETSIAELEGYRGAAPVRLGNAAETQLQLDVYGELLNLAEGWHQLGHAPDHDYWTFLAELVNAAARRWRRADRGIWEIRGRPRHFVLSKAMCWSALDRGIRLAQETRNEAPLDRWRQARDAVRRAVEENGYDPRRGVFMQAFRHPELDASLLLLPTSGLIDYEDERMVRTVDAIAEDLAEDGLLRRYASDSDGLRGREGVFLPCSFWLAECLARQNRISEAHAVFQRALSTGNDLGLFAEEYDVENREMLGNFPQGLTHLSLIAAAVALAEREDPTSASTRA
ncbi:MAG: glycoside hydrolase family 15 protein [Thiobacillaceae bacterium]